jgi:hypothetical protein
MADLVLGLGRELGETLPEARIIENGVVAEAARALRGLGDEPPDLADDLRDGPVGPGEDHGTDEPCPALRARDVAQEPEDLSQIPLVGRIGPGEAGGMDARSAAKRLDLEPGILGQGQQARQPGVVTACRGVRNVRPAGDRGRQGFAS